MIKRYEELIEVERQLKFGELISDPLLSEIEEGEETPQSHLKIDEAPSNDLKHKLTYASEAHDLSKIS